MTNLSFRPDAVAVLTLDQAASKANVLTTALWYELESAIDSLAGRSDLRGLVLASAKPDIFIAGADLKLLASAGPNDPAVRTFIERGLMVLGKLEQFPFPTAAAIDGAALGGGLEVALACDFRIAGPNPKLRLGLPEVTLGLIPGWGGTQRLPRLIGVPEATAMVTSGRSLEREEAKRLGLVDARAAESSSLVEESARFVLAAVRDPEVRRKKRSPMSLVSELTGAEQPGAESVAAAEGRRVVREGATRSLAEGLALETEAFLRLAGSEESKRLIGDFFVSRRR